ncbi:nucleotide sugar dehydrogenase [Novosphingobium panipatense]|uniref:nucleotide sugar dehydrogenase n=1 Tax=Novosphingobium panipatense TaxID=428991 RepID=UPI003622C2D9
MNSTDIATAPSLEDLKIAVVGLGYVGLPLAVEFGRIRDVTGFDINQSRIDALRRGEDTTLETDADELAAAKQLRFTTDPTDLAQCNLYIVTVPTPIDAHRRPDLTPLIKASETVGKVLKRGDIVVYESTVYPGATEEDCVPVLERLSGLTYNHDFFCGYSPERINPGDKAHRLPTIRKVTSGSTPKSQRWSISFMPQSSPRAHTRRRRSVSPKRPRSSKTPSATSTSR